MDAIKEQLQAVLADDELFDLAAQAQRKAYEALKKVGFSADEAVTLLANQGLKGLFGTN